MRKISVLLLTISLAFVLMACGNNNDKNNEAANNNKNNENEEVNNDGSDGLVPEDEVDAPKEVVLNDDEKVAEDEVVLKINDSEITGDEYNFTYLNAKTHLSQIGLDPENAEEAKELTIGSIVEQQVLKQEGEKEGIEISEEDVDKEFEAANEQSEEQLLAFLEEHDISEATYKKVLLASMIREQYLESVITTEELTDEEVEEAYEKLKESDPEIPDLDEVRGELEEILMSQNEQEQAQEKIKELVDAADVEELI